MKSLLISLLIFIFLSTNCISGNLVGIWQKSTSEISSGYLDSYLFFSDGTFRFNTNQYDGLRRVLSIGGKYKIENEKIIFIIEYTIEVIGGVFERS